MRHSVHDANGVVPESDRARSRRILDNPGVVLLVKHESIDIRFVVMFITEEVQLLARRNPYDLIDEFTRSVYDSNGKRIFRIRFNDPLVFIGLCQCRLDEPEQLIEVRILRQFVLGRAYLS